MAWFGCAMDMNSGWEYSLALQLLQLLLLYAVCSAEQVEFNEYE